MTLKKIEQMSESNPFLRPYEVEISKKVKLISEPREIHTKFNEEGEDSMIVDVELSTPLTPQQYETMIPSPQERVARTKTANRSWFLNATNLNFLIDKFGDQESEWVYKEVDLETIHQDVMGTLRKVIYVKGAKVLA